MFGPNARTLTGQPGNFHHRSATYRELLTEAVDLFRERFSVPLDSDVLLLTGSGTLANESVFASSNRSWRVERADLEFAARLEMLARAHDVFSPESTHAAWVGYDTATSFATPPPPKVGAWMVDMVSAFPYYPALQEAEIWTTVTSKQLGALPVMGIVVVSPRGWDLLLDSRGAYSYLNLARYREQFQQRRESPHTPAIPLVADLARVLHLFDAKKLREKIDERRALLVALLDPEHVVGDGPVLTLRLSAIPEEVAQRFDLYRTRDGYQVFLWSGTDKEHASLRSAIGGRP